MSAEAWKKVTVGIAADAASVTDQPTDAVAQAERELDLAAAALAKGMWGAIAGLRGRYVNARIAYRRAVGAAVRAECAAKVWGFADAYPTDVWPEAEFSDAQAASVMRLMMPRILAALEAP